MRTPRGTCAIGGNCLSRAGDVLVIEDVIEGGPMTRWMHAPGLARRREPAGFDPVTLACKDGANPDVIEARVTHTKKTRSADDLRGRRATSMDRTVKSFVGTLGQDAEPFHIGATLSWRWDSLHTGLDPLSWIPNYATVSCCMNCSTMRSPHRTRRCRPRRALRGWDPPWHIRGCGAGGDLNARGRAAAAVHVMFAVPSVPRRHSNRSERRPTSARIDRAQRAEGIRSLPRRCETR